MFGDFEFWWDVLRAQTNVYISTINDEKQREISDFKNVKRFVGMFQKYRIEFWSPA